MIRKLFFAVVCVFQALLLFGNPNDLDTTLNGIGYETFSIPTSTLTSSNAVAVQPDGKTIVVGYIYLPPNSQPFLARFNVDGSFDTTFGASNGYVIFDSSVVSGMVGGVSVRVALQVDGKIVIIGLIYGTLFQYIIWRYNSDGTLDTSFNGTGYFTSLFGESSSQAYGLCIQPNSQILVVGTVNNTQILVARHNSDGTLDTSFGSPNGYVFLPISMYANPPIQYYGGFLVRLQSTGKIIIGASATISPSAQPQMVTIRLLTNGTVDTTFGTSGVTTTNIGYYSVPNDIAIYPSDQILFAGYSSPTSVTANQFFIVKYTEDGFLDTTFGNPLGYVTMQPTGWSAAKAWGVFCQPDGHAVVTGQATIAGVQSFAAMRFNADGSFNTSVNADGLFTQNFGVDISMTSNTAVQSNQKFLLTALTTTNLGFLARYIGGVMPTYPLSTIELYGYNTSLISDFLYNDGYASIITDATARAATKAAIDLILANYATDYVNQPNFNFVYYLYLLQEEFSVARSDLFRAFPNSVIEIGQFFVYLFERIEALSASAN